MHVPVAQPLAASPTERALGASMSVTFTWFNKSGCTGSKAGRRAPLAESSTACRAARVKGRGRRNGRWEASMGRRCSAEFAAIGVRQMAGRTLG